MFKSLIIMYHSCTSFLTRCTTLINITFLIFISAYLSSVSTPAPTTPSNVVSVGGELLFTCQFAFDDTCGMKLDSQWFLNSGGTRSDNTGPEGDHTSGDGEKKKLLEDWDQGG